MKSYETPPVLRGSTAEQLGLLRSYLYRLSLALTEARSAAETGTLSPVAEKRLTAAAAETVRQEMTAGSADLKALIVKTADLVRQEMDAVTAALQGEYVAKSEFGTYAEEMDARYTVTAADVTALYNICSSLEGSVQAAEGELQAYVTETKGFIRAGVVEYEGTVPVLGIAIGQDITVKGMETVDGKTVEVLNTANMTTWTPAKMTFYQNGTAVAYLSNEKLYVTGARITGQLELGGKWEVSHRSGLTVKWIG